MSERKSMMEWLREYGSFVSTPVEEMARRIDAQEQRLDALAALALAVLEKPVPTFTTAFGSSKPEGVYVKPGDLVQWKGEMVVVAENYSSSAGLYVWTWPHGKPTTRVAQRKDLTVDGKPVLGLERER
jgi:hypothetical protein